jgi:hypothetical protein
MQLEKDWCGFRIPSIYSYIWRQGNVILAYEEKYMQIMETSRKDYKAVIMLNVCRKNGYLFRIINNPEENQNVEEKQNINLCVHNLINGFFGKNLHDY